MAQRGRPRKNATAHIYGDGHLKTRKMMPVYPEDREKLEAFRKKWQETQKLPDQTQRQAFTKALDLALEAITGTGRISTSLFADLSRIASEIGLARCVRITPYVHHGHYHQETFMNNISASGCEVS